MTLRYACEMMETEEECKLGGLARKRGEMAPATATPTNHPMAR